MYGVIKDHYKTMKNYDFETSLNFDELCENDD